MSSSHDAFESFVRESSTRLLRTALLLCGNRAEAEDLVQMAFTIAYRRWTLVAKAENPLAYTRQILTRSYLGSRKRDSARLVHHGRTCIEDQATQASTDEPPMGPVETRLSLLEALASLPPLDRAILVARYWEDLPVAETAALLDLTEGACRTRASRALSRLRRQFPELED